MVILVHELVAVDGRGRWCSCGEPFTLDHLGGVALTMLGAGLSIDEKRALERAQHARAMAERRETVRQEAAARAGDQLAFTRWILAEQQREWERVGAYLDGLGLSFLDRQDWLAEHYPNAERRRRYGY